MTTDEGYFIEHNGDCWQSIFPTAEAGLSQLHTSVDDAFSYMVDECNVAPEAIVILPVKLAGRSWKKD